MKAFLKAYLPHIVGLTLIALLVVAGWQWVAGLGGTSAGGCSARA